MGCIQPEEKPGPLQNESRSVALGDAKTVNAQIVMGVGQLFLMGGATNLMDANFIYNVASWNPEVTYSVKDGVGDLRVRQPSASGASLRGR